MSGNCEDALNQIYAYLDKELDKSQLDDLETHLKGCSPCLEMFDFEAQLKVLISERCRDKVPDSVRNRIQAALKAAEEQENPNAGV